MQSLSMNRFVLLLALLLFLVTGTSAMTLPGVFSTTTDLATPVARVAEKAARNLPPSTLVKRHNWVLMCYNKDSKGNLVDNIALSKKCAFGPHHYYCDQGCKSSPI
jgi:hypothetical protein